MKGGDDMRTTATANTAPIGRLYARADEKGFRIVCPRCAGPLGFILPGRVRAAVYAENVWPYRAVCAVCEKILEPGRPGWPELYDGRP